jgi:hypothetical protein
LRAESRTAIDRAKPVEAHAQLKAKAANSNPQIELVHDTTHQAMSDKSQPNRLFRAVMPTREGVDP